MALRDIFDSDPRSKTQLRDEIRELTLTLEQRASELKARVDSSEKAAVQLRNELDTARRELKGLEHVSKLAVDRQSASERAWSAEFGELKARLESALVKVDRHSIELDEFERKLLQSRLALGVQKVANSRLAKQIQIMNSEAAELGANVKSVNIERRSVEEREALVHRNFAELQRREADLANRTEVLDARERFLGISASQDLLAKPDEATELRAKLRQVERDLRESKFLYEAMFEPYKEKAKREGRPILDVQVQDLQTKLFEATERIHELEVGRLPELIAVKQELEDFKSVNERLRDDVRSKDRTIRNHQAKVDEDVARLNGEVAHHKAVVADISQRARSNEELLRTRQSEISKLQRELRSLVSRGAANPATTVNTISRARDLGGGTSRELASHLPIAFTDSRVLSWIFSEATPGACGVENGYLSFMGDGPWEGRVLGGLMVAQSFSLWEVPDADVLHLVVGTAGWSPTSLGEQIAATEGEILRIYSQEMWFAFLATGRDPFATGDVELLLAFAKGHPALEYLMAADCKWPEISIRAPGTVTHPPPGELGVLESPMHMLDYRVGVSSPHDEQTRRAILSRCFGATNLPFGDDCSPSYRAGWGTAKSAQRLYRMALHIKVLVEGPNGKDARRPQASVDWVSDLNWLKQTYFKRTLHRFKWPGL